MIAFIIEKRTFDVKPGKDKTLEMNKQGNYLLEDVLHHRRFSFRVRELFVIPNRVSLQNWYLKWTFLRRKQQSRMFQT